MRFLLLGISSLVGSMAFAGPLSEIDVYKRCYARMVNSIPLPTESRYVAVKNGTKTGAAACIELFDVAGFGTDGVLKNKTNAQAKKILKTFNDLHKTWFQSRVVADAMASSLNDVEEPALYFTRAAFSPSTEFKTIVTGTTGLRGVRVPSQPGLSKFESQRLFAYGSTFAFANSKDFLVASTIWALNTAGTTYTNKGYKANVASNNDVVDFGELIGIKASSPFYLTETYGSYPINLASASDAEKADRLAAANTLFAAPMDYRAHHGGGIVGSQAFLMSNMNLTIGQIPDEYSLINRRLTSRVFEDILCHQNPTLKPADVQAETNALIKAKTPHAFQQSTSCMQCHSGIDGMGLAMRNLFLSESSRLPNVNTQNVGMRLLGVVKLPAVPNATAFAFKAPTGLLHYRENFTNAQVKSSISSLAQMGTILSQKNDIYYCAAKRYYHFFTGINVDITQPPDSKDPNYKLNLKHYNKVKALGASLKNTQKVRTLLFEIFKSDAFRSWNFQSKEEQ